MTIKQFEVSGLAQYSYVVASQGEAVVIDPMRDFERYLAYANEHDLQIRFVAETHIHADFASGASALAIETGAELALSGYDEDELYRYAMPHRRLVDGDEIKVGTVRLRVVHTPGHTPEHLSFLLFDNARDGTVPLAMFTGDFLFVGSLGRPDLLGDDEKQRLATELYRSLHQRIAPLPDALQIYPGHGAGSLCGAGISERPDSTLGYERATQRLLRMEEKTFVKEILMSVPPMPSYYPRMKSLNAKGAPSFRAVDAIRLLSAEELQPYVGREDAIVLDLRRPEAFSGAHIPSAVNIGMGQNLSLWAGWTLNPEKPIILVSESGITNDAVLSLLRVGLDNIVGSLRKGMSTWIEAGLDLAQTSQVSTIDVVEHKRDWLILDVRSKQEWNSGHIAGAENMMLGDLQREVNSLPKNRAILTVCGSGYRSTIAASLLQARGLSEVSSMDGGMSAWNRRKFPVD
jgi:hydroxyacylglutathione hydrolase